jgi:hypothetical protein
MEELDEFEKYLTTLEKTVLKDGVKVKAKANSVSLNTALKKYQALKPGILKQGIVEWLESEIQQLEVIGNQRTNIDFLKGILAKLKVE